MPICSLRTRCVVWTWWASVTRTIQWQLPIFKCRYRLNQSNYQNVLTVKWGWFTLYYIHNFSASRPQDISVVWLRLCISWFNALDYGMFKCYYSYSSCSYNRSDSAIVKIMFVRTYLVPVIFRSPTAGPATEPEYSKNHIISNVFLSRASIDTSTGNKVHFLLVSGFLSLENRYNLLSTSANDDLMLRHRFIYKYSWKQMSDGHRTRISFDFYLW
jgi:hypothetical protein